MRSGRRLFALFSSIISVAAAAVGFHRRKSSPLEIPISSGPSKKSRNRPKMSAHGAKVLLKRRRAKKFAKRSKQMNWRLK